MSNETARELQRLIRQDQTLGFSDQAAWQVALLLSVAGVRLPPRVLITHDEMGELNEATVGTVVRDVEGTVFEWDGLHWWVPGDDQAFALDAMVGPVMILWEPSS